MAYEIPPFNSKTRRRMGTRTINYENWYNNVNNPYAYLYGIGDSPLMQFETFQGEPVERIKIDTQPNQFQIDFTDADQMIDENLYNPASEPPEYSASDQQSNSKLNWKGIGDLATTAAGHIADIVNSTKSTITIPKYTNYHADSINDLSDLGNMHKTYLNKDTLLQKPTAKTFFGDFFKKSTEGAIAGSSLGPWGILGGAIGGGLASIGNIAAKRSTYNKDLNAISRFNRLENIAFNNAYNTGLNNIIDNKNHSMYKQRLIGNYNAAGGPLGSEEQMGVTTFNTGGTHEMNQNGGIPQGVGDNGNTNLVEEGEVKWNDFIFSNRIQPNADILSKYNTLFNKKFNSYADAANFILDLHKERENNPFDKSTLNVQMQRLADAQEYQKLSDEAAQYGLTPEEYVVAQQQLIQSQNEYASGGPLGKSWFNNAFQARKNAASAYDSQGNLVKPLTTDVYRGTENKTSDKYRKQIPSEVWDAVLKFIESYYGLYNYTWEYNEEGRLSKNEQDRYDTVTKRINDSAKVLSKYASFCEAYDRVNGTKTADQFKKAFFDKGHFYGRGAFHGNNIYRMLVNEETIKSALPALNSARSDRYKLAKDVFGQTKDLTLVTPYKPTMVMTSNVMIDPLQTATQKNINTSTQTYPVSQTNPTSYGTTSVISQPSNSLSGISYYNADSQRYIPSTEYNADPSKYPNVYTITNRKGLNGNINYDNNPNYKSKVDNLTDDDWEQIKNRLQERNPSFYGKHDDLQYYKDKAVDGNFGPIHREIIAYNPTTDNADLVNNSTPESILDEVLNEDVIAPDINTNQSNNVETNPNPNSEFQGSVEKHPWYFSALRMSPIFDNLRSILTQDNPDYTYANQIASTYRPVSSYPIGQYQRFQPVDQHYLDTQANQRANTQYGFYKNNVQSSSAANAYATLAAANQSAAVNDAYIRALQTNNQNRNAALQYNNQLDRANEEARRATQAANYSNYANIMGNSYAAAEQERLAVENARETNMQNLAMNLGNLGRELYDRWRIAKDPTNAYDADFNYQGRIPYFWNPTTKQFEPAERG